MRGTFMLKSVLIVAAMIAPSAVQASHGEMSREVMEAMLCAQAGSLHALLSQLGQMRGMPPAVRESHIRMHIVPVGKNFTSLCRTYSRRYGRAKLMALAKRNRFADILP